MLPRCVGASDVDRTLAVTFGIWTPAQAARQAAAIQRAPALCSGRIVEGPYARRQVSGNPTLRPLAPLYNLHS
jgi:hypothetical protein